MSGRRIQRKRTKGWKMPKGAVYVGRPSKWGNYAALRRGITDNFLAALEFEHWWNTEASWAFRCDARKQLAGKTLACWCRPDQSCHGDVLLKMVNR